jgi:hypothetical protein
MWIWMRRADRGDHGILNGQDLEQAVSQAALTLEDFYQVAQQMLDALSNGDRMNLLHAISSVQHSGDVAGEWQVRVEVCRFRPGKIFREAGETDGAAGRHGAGSIYYMAPEQFERQPLDHRTTSTRWDACFILH